MDWDVWFQHVYGLDKYNAFVKTINRSYHLRSLQSKNVFTECYSIISDSNNTHNNNNNNNKDFIFMKRMKMELSCWNQ